jgi:hypothetical protein
MQRSCKVWLTSRHAQNNFIFYGFQKLNLLYKIYIYKKNVDDMARSYIGQGKVMLRSSKGHAEVMQGMAYITTCSK